MRQLTIAIAMLLATQACQLSDSEWSASQPTETPHTITLSIDHTATRVEFDGIETSWGGADMVHFAQIADDGQSFVSASRYTSYKIDPTSISDNGKRANFTAIWSTMTLEDNAQYIAFTGSQSYSGSSEYINVFEFATEQTYSASTQHLNDTWIMVSQPFTYREPSTAEQQEEEMSLIFSHATSIVSLTLDMELDDEQSVQIEQVRLRSPWNSFSDDLKILIDGQVTAYGSCDDSYIMNICDSQSSDYATLDATHGYTVNFQVWWDPRIEESSGQFTITAKCSDGRMSQISTPAKALSAGRLYTKQLTLPAPTANTQVDDDRAALVEIYNSAGGSAWTNSTNWNTSSPLDEWYGVVCDEFSGRVVELKLNNNLLTSIPSAIAQLSDLERLQLAQNNLSVTLPEAICRLENLRELNLCSNGLYGDLPTAIEGLTHLEKLYMYNNGFTTIPESIGSLEWLEELNLCGNLICDTIPESICQLENLTLLNLSYNRLVEQIPPQMGNIPGLVSIDLSYNQLEGTIPDSFANLAEESVVLLNNNLLSGEVSDEVVAHPNFGSWNISQNSGLTTSDGQPL